MDFKELVLKNRSYRRFDGSKAIASETLRDLIELARNVPSGANKQPLRYACSCTAESNAKVYETLGWAGYLTDWKGPNPDERPTGYIIILSDKEGGGGESTDSGISAQTILLGAAELNLGGCMFGNIRKPALRQLLGVEDRYEIVLVVALGVPVEKVVIEDIPDNGSIKYWRDESGIHHVPKRALDDIILETDVS
ncbi:MAG: nitroreductase family protein [Spirochaetales bacterium]|jgi:nitroreductase|nr:nitroreductase family protein [Spirochaetales bacterium]